MMSIFILTTAVNVFMFVVLRGLTSIDIAMVWAGGVLFGEIVTWLVFVHVDKNNQAIERAAAREDTQP